MRILLFVLSLMQRESSILQTVQTGFHESSTWRSSELLRWE